MNRAPTAWLTIDIAGIGEKPATRSGPYFLMVWTWAAAAISAASHPSARTNPPFPRAALYRFDFSGS